MVNVDEHWFTLHRLRLDYEVSEINHNVMNYQTDSGKIYIAIVSLSEHYSKLALLFYN